MWFVSVSSDDFSLSSHQLLSLTVTGLIFYDTKVTVMNRVLNATVQRTADHAAPEITLDPLEIVGGMCLFVSTEFQSTKEEQKKLLILFFFCVVVSELT